MNDISVDRKALFERNLEAFRQNYRLGFDIIMSIAKPHSRISWHADGEPDIEFEGQFLYGKGADTYSREIIDEHWGQLRRLTITPPQTTNLDDYSGYFLVRVMERALEAKLEFTAGPDENECFHLICFGIGLGVHIMPIIEKSKCQSIILCEPNAEFLYHSCFVTDWAAIFEYFSEPGRHISFSITDNHLKMAVEIRNAVRVTNICAFDGAIMFRLYTSSIMDRANIKIREDGNLFLTGLGFATDEIVMVTNTFHNLKNGQALIYKRNPVRQEFPFFIVGSGPSIDTSIEIIKRNQDKAFIISLGTALTVLVQNGIMPDFHVELENVPATYDVLHKFSKVGDFRRTCLVATTTVDRRIPSLFDRTVFFFRMGVTSFPMFTPSNDHTIKESGPLVCNLGLSFAQELGGQEYYLFGVDLGARKAEVHHSRFAPYHDGEESKYMEGEMAVFEGDFKQWVPANFGGKAITGSYHLWARDVIERTIVFNRAGRKYFNCSDGIKIDGMTPRKPRNVDLPARGDKGAAVQRILDGFDPYTPEEFKRRWDEVDWSKRFADFGDELIQICNDADDDDDNLYVDKMVDLLVRSPHPPSQILLYRGSLLMTLTALYWYASRISPKSRRREFNAMARASLIETIEKLKLLACNLVKKLNEER